MNQNLSSKSIILCSHDFPSESSKIYLVFYFSAVMLSTFLSYNVCDVGLFETLFINPSFLQFSINLAQLKGYYFNSYTDLILFILSA